MTGSAVEIATFLPTTASTDGLWSKPEQNLEAAQLAESLGFDALWIGDHYLTSPVHHESWLDPMMMLAYLAAGTSRITLGPAILVTPVRQPVWLAKQSTTLQYVSGGRFSLCLATGFSPIEFAAVDVPLTERGRRQNEIQEILQGLLSGKHYEFHGKYYDFPSIIMEPVPTKPIPLLIAGGTQPNHTKPITDSVVHRIASGDGWVTPTFSPAELIRADWERVSAERSRLGIGQDPYTFAHMNFIHVVETDDDEVAFAEQEPVFYHHFGDNREWPVIQQGHFVGSIARIVAAIRDRIDLGCNHISLQAVVREPDQVARQWRLIEKHIIPQIRDYKPQR